jgi:O-antigen/teichoic acid export membrane protein
VTIFVEALSIVQITLLKREMDFKSLAIRTNAATFTSGLIGVGLALMGYGVWALVFQQIVKDVIALVLLWNLSTWRPTFSFSWKHLRELMGFSVPNFLAQLGIFADAQAASIVLGLLFGPLAVGLYRIADRIVNNVVSMVMASIQGVSFPEFARLQDKPDELRKSVLTCLRLSATVTLPALAGLAVVGDHLMATLGSKWTPAAGVLKALAVLGMAIIFANFTGPILQAKAKTREVAYLVWGRTVVGLVILVAAGLLVRGSAVNLQIMGIALSRLILGVFLVLPIFFWILMRESGISMREVLTAIAPAALSAAVVVGAVKLFQLIGWPATAKPVIVLTIETALGAAAGIATLLWLDAHLGGAVRALIEKWLAPPVLSKPVVNDGKRSSLRIGSDRQYENINTNSNV